MKTGKTRMARKLATKMFLHELRAAAEGGMRIKDEAAAEEYCNRDADEFLSRPEVQTLPVLQQPQAAFRLWLEA
jgi:hypothetical protein